jgi:aspartyl-tRNA(Asn)/glutamyl-tRNA(Gln) amidotransferase subunit A
LAFGPDECRIVAMEASASAITDPADLGVLGAAALLRSRELSAVELLAACQRRILGRNGGQPSFDGAPGAVNAWIRLYPEAALEQAAAADRRLAREGLAAPLLCGIPLGLKDLFAVEGLPVTASSRVLANHVAPRSSTAWRRLAAAGMVLAGHTHTHEFGAGGTTDQVGNPRALDHSAGGSSGGSAAALACGMVAAALGTDSAGSLRIPASLCGVSSVKPTHGLIPLAGIIPLAPSLDHAGPMARSLADCSALLGALACEQALRAGERLGARIIERPAVAELPDPEFSAILLSEAAAYHLRHFRPDAGYRTSIREFVEQSQAFTAVDAYLQAQRRRARVTAEWEDWFSAHGVDAILEPTTSATAPRRGSGYDSGQAAGQGDPLIRLTATWNVTGFPVAAMPAGLGSRSGLPVGVSLIGPRGAEARLLQIGIDLQAHALPPLPTAEPRLPPAAAVPDS